MCAVTLGTYGANANWGRRKRFGHFCCQVLYGNTPCAHTVRLVEETSQQQDRRDAVIGTTDRVRAVGVDYEPTLSQSLAQLPQNKTQQTIR
jgi:hypothetical protein